MKKEETTSVKDLQPNVITNAIIEQEEEESVINDISIEENLEEIMKKVQEKGLGERKKEEFFKDEKISEKKVEMEIKHVMENNLEPKMEASVHLSDEDQNLTGKDQIEEEGSGIEAPTFISHDESSKIDSIETNKQDEVEAEVVLKETNNNKLGLSCAKLSISWSLPSLGLGLWLV